LTSYRAEAPIDVYAHISVEDIWATRGTVYFNRREIAWLASRRRRSLFEISRLVRLLPER